MTIDVTEDAVDEQENTGDNKDDLLARIVKILEEM